MCQQLSTFLIQNVNFVNILEMMNSCKASLMFVFFQNNNGDDDQET